MALTPSFSVSQSYATPNIISLVDTSTGSDVTITQRRVYLRTANGQYLVPAGVTTTYTPWSYSVSFIDIDVLQTDYAIQVTVEWLDVSDVVQYTVSELFCFDLYNKLFVYQLTQDESNGLQNLTNQNYYANKQRLITDIESSEYAVSLGTDIRSAQNALDDANYLRDNQNDFF